VKELIPKQTNKRGRQMDMKSLCIILAYMMRLSELDAKIFEKDLEFILGKAPFLIQLMIEMTIQLAFEYKMKRSKKRVTIKNFITIIEFS
jgi:hypothetical protein